MTINKEIVDFTALRKDFPILEETNRGKKLFTSIALRLRKSPNRSLMLSHVFI